MKLKKAPFPIQKRSFLLFELLISLALIALCLFPLIKPHVLMRNEANKELMKMQLERLAQEAFCALKEELHENRHPWDSLGAITEQRLEKEQPFTLVTGKHSTKPLICTYTLKEIDSCDKRSQNRSGLLLALSLKFSTTNHEVLSTYERTLYLERAEAS